MHAYGITGHLEEYILPKADKGSCPPLFLLEYLVRNITQPDLIYDELMSLLSLLAQIEHVRILAEEQAQKALELNERSSKQGKSSIRLLDKKERKELGGFVRGKAIVRLTYLDGIVLPLYRLVSPLSRLEDCRSQRTYTV